MDDLSPTMKLCYLEIKRAPGTMAKELPGGTGTVQALMRRGLAEIQGETWRVFRPEHQHAFKTSLHLDGCHFYETRAACDCGVQYRFLGERSVKADPYSMMWMDEGDECERCAELAGGARPRHDLIIARPDNWQPNLTVAA